jgi:methionyl aminopeptidase
MSLMRSTTDLDNLRYSSRILASIFWHLRSSIVKPGVDASVIDKFVHDFAAHYNAVPSFQGYKGYSYNLNFSIDNQVTHAFPSKGRKVPNNALLKIDIGIKYKGMISDACQTFVMGKVTDQAQQLSDVCKQAMYAGIDQIKAGAKIGDIGSAVDAYAKKHKFGNVRVLGGHGVGYELHDDPWIPHYGKAGKGSKLFVNQVITVEPMFNLGGDDIEFSDTDGWTVTTTDGSLSAQWEHTILVTSKGHEILTEIAEVDVLPLP